MSGDVRKMAMMTKIRAEIIVAGCREPLGAFLYCLRGASCLVIATEHNNFSYEGRSLKIQVMAGSCMLANVEVGCVAFLDRSTWGARARDTYDATHVCNEAKIVADRVAVKHSHQTRVATTVSGRQILYPTVSMRCHITPVVKYHFLSLGLTVE